MTKITLCSGHRAKIKEWQSSQKEYFSKGDNEYSKIKEKTLDWLKKLSRKKNIVTVPYVRTSVIYIAFKNFLKKINFVYYKPKYIKLFQQMFFLGFIKFDKKNIRKINS